MDTGARSQVLAKQANAFEGGAANQQDPWKTGEQDVEQQPAGQNAALNRAIDTYSRG